MHRPKIRILVADDTENLRELIDETLQAAGYEVVTAADGAEALAAFGRGRFDLVILDIYMPGVDGIEACRRIREGSQVPILIMSGAGSALSAIASGANKFLKKPFGYKNLLTAVEELLEKQAASC